VQLKESACHTECINPTPACKSVCEEPLCDWKCHRPADCKKTKCALVCKTSPHCQPQATPTDCCESKESATKCGKCEDTACASGNAGNSAPLGCKHFANNVTPVGEQGAMGANMCTTMNQFISNVIIYKWKCMKVVIMI